ncbi:uncharacterized protein LOC128778659 [Panthera pardus]|uniref:Uncharacterized protein LOC128778659 n=1 Tax=Panthera pardus TaxID=9691 RepID=A0A9W2W1H7_PANPR|nr:uncharacterized protein LOC128778659 [Panthera pardus]
MVCQFSFLDPDFFGLHSASPLSSWPKMAARAQALTSLSQASGGRRGQRRSRSQGDHPTAIWGPSPELSHDASAYPTGHTTTVTQGMLGNIFSPENWSTWAIWCASDAPRESSSMCGARLLLHGSRAQAPAKAPSCSPGQGSRLGDGEGSQGDPQPREEGEHVPLPPARWAQVSRPGEHDHGRRLTLDRVPQDPHQPRPEPGAPRRVPRVASGAKSLVSREEGCQSPRLLTALLASQDSPTGICTPTSGGHVRPACVPVTSKAPAPSRSPHVTTFPPRLRREPQDEP